eukprot:COSAG02_NODE_38952_length_422_cov_31.978328_1_plen_48_part_01
MEAKTALVGNDKSKSTHPVGVDKTKQKVRRERGSNTRPSDLQSDALPT